MNLPEEFSADEVLDDAAAAWLCERDEGFNPDRAQAFAAWCEGDQRHAAAVARVERALALLNEMPAVSARLKTRLERSAISAPRRTRKIGHLPRRIWLSGLAAVFAVTVAAWWLVIPPAPSNVQYVAEPGTQRRIELSDGSVLDLNGGSAARVQFSARERHVLLAQGEAHFSVVRDAKRPFTVTAGGVSVQAIGTGFNVRLGADEVAVLVTEGTVEVKRVAPETIRTAIDTPRVAEPTRATKPAVLTAHERTVIPMTEAAMTLQVERVSAHRMRKFLAWQEQMTQFTDVPLCEIIQRFNRLNVLQLVLDDPILGSKRIGGVLALDQPEAFVRLLEADGDIVAEPRGENEILLSAPR
jgi:transmembrane sensor